MRSVHCAQTGSEGYERWLPQALGLPAVCALLALSVHLAGGDLAISALFFDPSTGEFPLRDQQLLELIGHKLAKSLVVALWCGLLAAAAASSSVAELRGNRRLLWATVVAMALGPVVVAILKELTTLLCPWNLQRFGGLSQDVDFGFTLPSRAGHCFPAGHSAGGFSLFALAFAERSRGNARAMRIGARHGAHCGHRLQPGSGRPGSAFPEQYVVGGGDRLALRRAGLQALSTLQRPDHARGTAVMPLRFALGGADGGSGQ